MTGNLKLFINFIWKFMGTVRFRNDHVAAILGFGDLQWRNILITRVYFVEGLGHNLFSVGQFCDSDLEVAFRRDACFIRNLEGVDLLKGDCLTNLYTINLHEMASASPICLMARKSKRASHPPKPVPNSRQRLHLLHMDLCRPMRIASINGKRISILLQSPVIIIRTDNSTEFKNQVRKEYFDTVGISHQMSSVRTPQQNGVVERQNRTLVEAARTMLIFSRAPLFYGLRRLLLRVSLKTAPLFINDREDIGKLGAKGDIGFLIVYSADSCAYRIFNRQTNKIMETMNVSFDELFVMAFEQRNSKPELNSMTAGHISSGLDLTYAPSTITTQQPSEGELDLLFEAMYDDYIGSTVSYCENCSACSRTSKDVYVCQPEGFIDADHPSHVYKLKKALYGLKRFQDDILVVQVYVDDIIFGSTHPRYIQLFSDLMKSRFEMSMMGEMTLFLGLQVNQSPCDIFINQSKYALEILNKYGMKSCDPIGTPMEIQDKLVLDQNGTPVNATKYHSMIGALMYLTSSRPDIVHSTCLCARYQAKPTEKHLNEVERIFHYLQGTVNTGLWYSKDSGFELTGFSNADYAGCKDSFKSTFGGAQFLGEKLVRLYDAVDCESRICVSIHLLCPSPL
nr:hypothetical protein [Tanacetum cinerariifolium]